MDQKPDDSCRPEARPMIVCHCNVLSDQDIRGAVDELLQEMSIRVITPGLVYKMLGKRGRCCGCFPLAIDVINRHIALRLEEIGDRERLAVIAAQQQALRESIVARRREAVFA